MDYTQLFQTIVNGVTLGSVYALIALGYTMVYGILKLLNFAHGDVMMIGAYVGFGILTLFGGATDPSISIWIVLVLMAVAAMVVSAGLGVAIERFAYRPLRDAPRIAPADQRPGRLVLPRLQDAAPVQRAATARTTPFSMANGKLFEPGDHLGGVQHLVAARDRDRRGGGHSGRALAPRHAHAHRQGDARDLDRP